MFAHDTNLFLTGKNENELMHKVNNELQKLSKWLIANKLSLYVSKTHYMFIAGHKTINVNERILINGCNVSRVFKSKFLGIWIDHKLNWNDHIKHIKLKLSKSIGIICKAKKYFDKKKHH